jgi:hypothetical protein
MRKETVRAQLFLEKLDPDWRRVHGRADARAVAGRGSAFSLIWRSRIDHGRSTR